MKRQIVLLIAIMSLPALLLSACQGAPSPVDPETEPTAVPPTATTKPIPTSTTTPQPLTAEPPTPTAEPAKTEPTAGLANPAAVYCEEQGGQVEIRETDEGQVGYCVFPDGSECEEWAFYRGECVPGGTAEPPDTEILSATISAKFPQGAFDGVQVLPLDGSSNGRPLWAAFSIGMRSYNLDPVPSHFVAIYTHAGGDWQELARLDLDPEEEDVLGPDYIFEGGIERVQVEPSHVWLEVHGGAGAHGGTYHLLSFDGAELSAEAFSFSPSPGGGYVEDLNDDGIGEVILDATDPYVFCYACGVRLVQYTVLRWDGEQMVEVSLTPLPESSPSELRDLNNRAVELAEGGLWKDAWATIEEAMALDVEDQTVAWNAALIRLTAQGRRDIEGVYPLLTNVFYGDYAAALNVMHPYTPDQIFDLATPLIVGTVAEGWEKELADWIIASTTSALEVKPDLAAAYFLQGWARYLKDPADPQAQEDVARAAELNPDEPLFVFPDTGD